MRLSKDEELDRALYLLFVQKRNCSIIYSEFWLVMAFCNRHGIHSLGLEGEKLSADTEAPEPFKKEL